MCVCVHKHAHTHTHTHRLGKYEALWQCEEACISLPEGPSARVVKNNEVCVAFTYIAHGYVCVCVHASVCLHVRVRVWGWV